MLEFQAVIYGLCLLTSGFCAFLLVRSYLESRARLLLWSALCFVLLAANNLLIVIDLLVLPTVDLLPLRNLASLAAVSVLLFGFIWEVES
jgi:Na+-translocating ferredoxin:NAD+ oxidoreductase RnfA subunit